MSLFITTQSDSNRKITSNHWITNSLPAQLKHETVIEVQADGDELDRILQQAKNIPQTGHQVQVWRGVFAQFIVDNVKFD